MQPENVMCVTKDSNDVKIIDFGLAQRLEEGKQIKVLFGTAEFCAPEIINFEPVSFCTDMWSLGVVSYVLWVHNQFKVVFSDIYFSLCSLPTHINF